jgi:hypothetical protein
MIDYEAHFQALYDEMRAAMDAAGFSLVPILHVTSSSTQPNADPAPPPYVMYRQETERPIGTSGKGNSAILTTGFMITARDFDFASALGMISAIVNRLDVADATMVTADGYETTDIAMIGNQSLFEDDLNVYAQHLRVSWERSR